MLRFASQIKCVSKSYIIKKPGFGRIKMILMYPFEPRSDPKCKMLKIKLKANFFH